MNISSDSFDELTVRSAVSEMLKGFGVAERADSIAQTPTLVAAMYAELLSGERQDPLLELVETIPSTHRGSIILRGLRFHSLCAHHLLPFFGSASIAYIPGARGLAGFGRIARVLEICSRRLQFQEHLGQQVLAALEEGLKPQGAIVVLKAKHLCLSMRGAQQTEAEVCTVSASGVYNTNWGLRSEFLQSIEVMGSM